MYLCCFTGDRPRQWLRWLPWAKYTYNTAYQTSLRGMPFCVVYGGDPPSICSYEPGETRVAAIAQDMEAHEAFLADVRYRLEQAQASQKLYYDRQQRQVSYQVGDWALLRLRQRAASSLPRTTTGKLKPRFVGPYRVIEIINDVTIRLELPLGARLHDVFHVGVLKKFIGAPLASPPVLPAIHNCAVIPELLHVKQARLARGVHQVLVRWRGEPAESTSWEDLNEFHIKYPNFQLEDELGLEGEEMSCGGTRTGAVGTCAAPLNAQRTRRNRLPRVAKFSKRD
jgi:hypothetical protein